MNLTVYEGGLISASDADALVPQSQKRGCIYKGFLPEIPSYQCILMTLYITDVTIGNIHKPEMLQPQHDYIGK